MIQKQIFFKMKDGRQIELRSPRLDEAQETIEAMVEISETSPFILSTPQDFKKKTIEVQIKWIEESAQSDSAVTIAAFFAGKIIGLCSALSFKDSKRSHRAALGISIHPGFRAGGLGRKMTQLLVENMKAFKGIKMIELDVMSGNQAAIGLYESLGFKRAGVLPKAYVLQSGEVLDNISMYMDLID